LGIGDLFVFVIHERNHASHITTHQGITHRTSLLTNALFRFLMRRMLPAEAAVLAELEPLRRLLLVLGRAVVAPLAVAARQVNDVSHNIREF
jgi:hypothetical protein